MLFKPLLPVVEYVVFYDYIKNELCVNRDEPEMGCAGKCYLKKELAKASDTPENGQSKKHFSVETNVVFYQKTEDDFVFKPVFYIHESKTIPYHNLSYSYLEADAVFRPPIA